MQVDIRSLVKKLNSRGTQSMERAAERAQTAGHREVSVAHLLHVLLCDAANPCVLLLEQLGVASAPILRELEGHLAAMRPGAARPLFAPELVRLLRDTWLWASVERSVTQLDPADVLLQFCHEPARYMAGGLQGCNAVRRDEAVVCLQRLIEQSTAAQASAPTPASSQASEALQRFTTSFTERARRDQLDPVLGRSREVRQLVDILCRRRKNNPVIVGEAGVGKTALVEGLARAIANQEVPPALRDCDVRALDLGLLQAGASVRGQFEQRLQGVIDAVKEAQPPIILFIDEAHMLIGAGNAAGQGDAANLLKPELARGTLRTIAATTWSEYKKYFEKDAALERRFQPVHVREPDRDTAVDMLRGLAPRYARAHHVHITDAAVQAAVDLSRRYITGRQLPDKAIDLLDTAAARVRISHVAPPPRLTALRDQRDAWLRQRAAIAHDEQTAGTPQPDGLQDIDLDQLVAEEQALTQSWQQQQSDVHELQQARAAVQEQPVDVGAQQRLQAALAAHAERQQRLVFADVDAQAVAEVVATWTGIPVGDLQRGIMEKALNLDATLAASVRGQPQALQQVANSLRAGLAGIKPARTPLAVLLFAGPSGVGKTATARAVARALYGSEGAMVTLNMTEYQEPHTLSRLIGAPPGYVGFGEGGVLTEAVRQRPYSLVLLDECEKAHVDVMNVFHQIFDDGMVNDGEGRPIDFRNTVVVLTTNLGTAAIERLAHDAPPVDPDLGATQHAVHDELLQHFPASLLGRMTCVPFAPLAADVLVDIVQLKLAGLAERCAAAHSIQLVFAASVATQLAAWSAAAPTGMGARQLDRAITQSLCPSLSRHILLHLAQPQPLPTTLGVGWDGTAWRIDPL